MSKIGCECRHIIFDQTDALAYKAAFIRWQRNHLQGFAPDSKTYNATLNLKTASK